MMVMSAEENRNSSGEVRNLYHALEELEGQRAILGDQTVDLAQSAIHEKIARLAQETAASERQVRKLITILFADVSGFTAMAEAMDHEIVTGMINSLWSRVDRAIQEHGGRIDKHIGDAVMALFGTPTAREDDPERAIRAALQMQAEIQKWKDEFKATPSTRDQPPNIQLRIGINTGPALLGTVGTIGEYTAIGNTVNLASRLESAAPAGGILISHDTFQHVRGIFETAALEPIRVKGQSKPIQVYTVSGIKPREFRIAARGVEGIETRMIGREQELARMQTTLEQAASRRQLHLIHIVAEAGTGKSRLLYEFVKWLSVQSHGLYVMKGRATLETAQTPYALLRDLFSSSFGIQDHDGAAVARQKLENGILSHIGDEETATLYAHFIGHLIGLDYAASPHLKGILGDAQQIHSLAFHYASQYFSDIAGERVVVLLLEDIHWADRGSLDFFGHLMSSKLDIPLLIIGLTRSTLFEERPDWGKGAKHHLRIDLIPLSEENCRRLVEEILQKMPEIPSALMELIVDKAEGSPFYVEELIKVLIDKNIIVRDQDRWWVEMDRLSELKVPATLTGLVQVRLDSLQTNTRETLQQASVVGRIFWTPVVARMQNPESRPAQGPVPIDTELQVLRARELIFQYGDAVASKIPEFIFKNTILHNVTYESVLLRLRPVYHHQAAQGLIEISGERVNEYAGRVGEHYELAGEYQQAAYWYGKAGKQAQITYETDAAIRDFQKALDFFSRETSPVDVSFQLETHFQLGQVLNWQARYTEALEIYKTMLDLAKRYKEPIAQSQALQGIATSLSYRGEHRAALEYAIRAEEMARMMDEPLATAQALYAQGSARYRLGEPRAVFPLAEEALAIARRVHDLNEMGRSLNLIGAAHYVLGQYPEAQSHWEQALNIFQELSNKQQHLLLLNNLGAIADAIGDHETAFLRYQSALEISRDIGNRDGEILYLTNRGGQQVALGSFEAARTDLRQAIRLAGITGSWCMPIAFNYHAEALLGLGNFEEAFYSARQALILAEEDKAPESIGMAWRTLAMIADKSGRPASLWERGREQPVDHEPDECFAKSERIFTEAEIEVERARTLREWAGYEFSRKNKEHGVELWEQARAIFKKLGAGREVERMEQRPS
jgi:class 3 adenylate cyclase/tetratricopeptide (TPR) repeat protein